jgi:glutathione S-transferase
MSDELIFYTNPQSRGRIIRWMLEEIGQPYRTELLDYASSMKAPEFLAINPMGKVPAIRHGDTVVTESGAICAYLADAFPQAGLAPPLGDKRRGPYFRWMFFAAGPLESAITNKTLGLEVPAERRPMVGYGCYEDAINGAESALKAGDYLLGDQFSAADVYFGSAIGFYLQFGSLEPRPAFVAYAERLQARPAAIRARQTDDALIPAQPQPEPA